jgi:AcrR family transcriptional regulator
VCERAKLNPRYFYESFEDLDTLLVAVFDRTAGEAVAAMVAAVGPLVGTDDDEGFLRTAIGAAIRHVTEDPRRTRVLFMEGLNNAALGRRRFDALHEMAEGLVGDVRTRAEERLGPGAGTPSIAVVAANLMVGGLAELLMAFVNGLLDVTVEQLVEDTAALFLVIAKSVDAIVDGEAGSTGAP